MASPDLQRIFEHYNAASASRRLGVCSSSSDRRRSSAGSCRPQGARHWDQGWTAGKGVLWFKVESRERVDEIYADLTGAGYGDQQPPDDAFWGAKYAIVEDPDGNAVGLMSPAEPGRRRDPGFP